MGKARRLVELAARQVALKEVMGVALKVVEEEATVKASLVGEAMAAVVELVVVAALAGEGLATVVQGCLGSTHAEALRSGPQSASREMVAM